MRNSHRQRDAFPRSSTWSVLLAASCALGCVAPPCGPRCQNGLCPLFGQAMGDYSRWEEGCRGPRPFCGPGVVGPFHGYEPTCWTTFPGDWNNCPTYMPTESIGLGYEDDSAGQPPMPPMPVNGAPPPPVEPAPMPPSILPMPEAEAAYHAPPRAEVVEEPPVPFEFVRLPTLPYRWDFAPPVHVALEE